MDPLTILWETLFSLFWHVTLKTLSCKIVKPFCHTETLVVHPKSTCVLSQRVPFNLYPSWHPNQWLFRLHGSQILSFFNWKWETKHCQRTSRSSLLMKVTTRCCPEQHSTLGCGIKTDARHDTNPIVTIGGTIVGAKCPCPPTMLSQQCQMVDLPFTDHCGTNEPSKLWTFMEWK